jgi:hypothetical protein
MAWVRYDDQFPINGKVTAVIAEDPGALALHLLANTWSNTTRHPGYIPAHQPGILLADKQLGAKWADLLVRAGMFHKRGEECDDCREEYAELPADKSTGYVIHNAADYRAPQRDRTTAGTSAELSAKRREAGRRGGLASAARRKAEASKQNQANRACEANGQANQANSEHGAPRQEPAVEAAGPARLASVDAGKPPTPPPAETGFAVRANQANGQASASSKASNLPLAGVSPVPVPVNNVASNEATARPERTEPAEQGALDGMPADPPPKQPTVHDRAFGLARSWLKTRDDRGVPVAAAGRNGPLHVLKTLFEPFLNAGYGEDEINDALADLDEGIPSRQQLQRALAARRTGARFNRQGRLSGGLGQPAANSTRWTGPHTVEEAAGYYRRPQNHGGSR